MAVTVEGETEIELAGDLQAGLAPDAANRVPANVHRQDAGRLAFGLLGRVDDGDPSRLASAADWYLCLDRDAAELPRRRAGFRRGSGQPPLRDGDAGRSKLLLGLVLEELHERAV